MFQNTGKYISDKSNAFQSTEDATDVRIRKALENDTIDVRYGFNRIRDKRERTGFLINMHTTEILDENKRLLAAVDYYFMEEDGSRFKASLPFRPYFYILVKKENIRELTQFLSKKYLGLIAEIITVTKEDLDLPNHLIGLKQRYIKLSFTNSTDMIKVRKEILSSVKKNRERAKTNTVYTEMLTNHLTNDGANTASNKKLTDCMEHIIDIREYDVPYHVRVSIDNEVFCGSWYTVRGGGNVVIPPVFTKRDDLIERPDPIVLAFDIETTKLPLKFPVAETDQIMMISYMIDGQGYLITNREIISKDVEDFEYTPNKEFEGQFIIFNEKNEQQLLQKFFDHIMDVRPHIFVTYNGDFFDWPFVETRAAFHNLDMKKEIGFSKNTDGIYSCRAAMHMDCLCWVKRDSYLPVGSQGLKAVAKAKLRYDPVELDPEEMCNLAVNQSQVLSNYSVSDAVATYYLYMKYVHPFIFALCTIIPMEPDEVLRKGSGTLCEVLLMVQAFRADIIFPNKQETALGKLTADGHLLDQETYVGGHVEALESGVFRADIPCRFRLIPEAFDKLLAKVEHALKYAIEVEEGIPLNLVNNFDEIVNEVKEKLISLKSTPNRLENPVIYHLDVGAMYPNIILTNRLQPSAVVDESVCASCDFNKLDAVCKRNMTWMWRGEMMPASRNELLRIRQQLELEKFPPKFPNGPQRAFHQLSSEEQTAYEKKRLTDYCRKAYNKTKVTKVEERVTTVCQKENSFYVDTVRAFRDRRYEYKGLSKKSKQQVTEAVKTGNAEAIKSAKNREILYDSLQLAHKCILNSFYGYVMRRGARWHSMEMGGIVCYTGANIIMKAREIIEQVGRPLELDTDGIWCVLPASFPDTFTVLTNHVKKSKINISYPNAMLNAMVKDYFTNDQYHELVDAEARTYEIRSENSVFFEVDGPYLAMVLPASKEEGKKLKKRYAVFNFDGSLAELKGFEVKRRGELQLIKNFQSSVFEAFLKGNTLEECYASVANVANYWLDVLYSKGSYMPDSELFELISSNRSMSKTLEEYGSQKSTSISTAKRLAEFLGDEMVKDKGLACKYVISRKPEGSPVTERAIPLAIFQTEPSIKRHYLRKWLKDASIDDVDIREVLDWNYYIERLGGAIQKIITIPAALQGVSNPVPRIRHPDWLQKRLLEKNDTSRQRKINEMFVRKEATDEPRDIEDLTGDNSSPKQNRTVATVSKRKRNTSEEDSDPERLSKSWREVLGPPPPFGTTKEERTTWIVYQKKKWAWQAKQRGRENKGNKRARSNDADGASVVRANTATLGGFLKKAQNALLNSPWQIIQICETNEPGIFRVWALVGQELHQVRLTVPRVFYVNQKKPKVGDDGRETANGEMWKRCNRILPRSRPVHHLYRYSVPESIFKKSLRCLLTDLSTPDIEGIYETQTSLEFRAIVELGCVCRVIRTEARRSAQSGSNEVGGNVSFSLDQLQFRTVGHQPYLEKLPDGSSQLKHIYMYHHQGAVGHKAMFGLFLTPSQRALVIVLDTVRTNQLPNLSSLYAAERAFKIRRGKQESLLPPANDIQFEVRVETDPKQVYRALQRALQSYQDEKRGPTLLVAQTSLDLPVLAVRVPGLADFPTVRLHVRDVDTLYTTLEWQRVGVRAMIRHYLNSETIVGLVEDQCRYFHAPVGNLPGDPTTFGADLFFARNLQKHNFVLWCSPNEKPDLGGREADDNSLLTEFDEHASAVINNPGCYASVCVELDIDGLAVGTLLQSHRVHDADGTNSCVAFDNIPQQSLEEMLGTGTPVTPLQSYDETALCSPAFKILRSMVNAWLRDLTLYKNVFADFQIVHFYRWLRSPQALLYDPALRRSLHNLMNKLFLQLIAEIKRLGAVIVYANFNKIVICTKKRTVEAAIEYIEFVVRNVRNKDLFHSIDISYNQCWEYLMWQDAVNFGGVKGKLPQKIADGEDVAKRTENDAKDNSEENENVADTDRSGEVEKEQADDDDNLPEIIMNWNMAEYLPDEAMCQSHFNSMIGGYVSAVYGHLRSSGILTAMTPEPRIVPLNSQGEITTQLPSHGLAAHATVVDFCKKLISGNMSQKLFTLAQKIHYQQPECAAPEMLQINGYKRVNPALELTKAIHKALSLDPSVKDEVDSLRRNMLQLIGVGAFSDSANWIEPCTSFVLREVICKACNHCRDIELLKDNFRTLENDKLVCKCPLCGANYENDLIEYLVIDALKRKTMSYTLQDLQCRKCSQIKFENMSERCDCAGNFKTVIDRAELIRSIETFKIIARMFEMPLLDETVRWVLSLC